MDEKENILKLCLMGDGAVGKTTFCNRISSGIFNPAMAMTIGADIHVVRLTILEPNSNPPNKVNITIQIWDLGGQQQYRFMQADFVKGAMGGILMYDLTRNSTELNLGNWISGIWREYNGTEVPLYLVGAKTDLLNPAALKLAEAHIKELAAELNISKYFLISCSKSSI